MAWSVMSHRAHNLCQKFCPRQMMRSLFTSNRPTVRQQFGNSVICSTHSPLQPKPWGGGLKTVLKSLPSGPDACADLIFRACTKQCTQISANVSSTMHSNMQMPCHWRYLLQRLNNDETLHPLTLSINWLLTSCHAD